ncbi:hypothetical protein Nhal_1859 [Nitrosococcus halophilus Nc 4]|uniref:Uncharacterized protein n=1 Tax=Nitrosococcus halophilus (strain Nc4) TaxID=472759 RepID=D5C368_NITHN|nr:hypothetical protein [Nitrosococcus halophilus]ADE14960.1 hypothetical protein Nhal_1840 [Nitrosococcus halophilus Nc 4]ADE14976.1 hypothetical protein Nhal_1859 [Nitrosococcus halophilus Nc 4]
MMRRQARFRCVAQRGWYFMTREGRVGFFDTRREAEVMYQRYAREKVMTYKRKREKGSKEFRPII